MKSFIIYTLMLTAFLGGCKKSDLMKYEAANDIYFAYTSRNVVYDTANVSFATRNTAVMDSVLFYVNILGNLADRDKLFQMEVDEANTTAIAGKHYEMPGTDTLLIPAETYRKRVKIGILRPADLRDKSVVLTLKLVPNANFTTGMAVYDYSKVQVVSATKLKITIADILLIPERWASSINYLGSYSREKLEAMTTAISLDINKFYSGTLYTATQQNNYAVTFQRYLNTQKALGNIIREKDGSEMKMGPLAQ